MTSEQIALSLEGVTVELGGKRILDNVNAQVRAGEVFGIIGPNGSGKTTLLKCVSRTISLISGCISIRGKPIDEYSDRDFSIEVSAMLPHWPSGFSIDAYEIVLMGCRNRTKGIWWEGGEELSVVDGVLRQLNAQDLVHRDFDTLSSGEQRKILIAKSLAQRTGIILLDEPVAYLDLRHKLEVMEVMRDLANHGHTVVMSLHELELAAKYCDHLMALDSGNVKFFGTPREVVTVDLLREVYGVQACVRWDEECNFATIIPYSPKNRKGG